MGVQITVSGKLRGDRSSFEKHTVGILPRAGHRAQVVVDEDTAHVQTPMGLIGIRIRIAHKERVRPEFTLIKSKESESEDTTDNDKTDGSKRGAKSDKGRRRRVR